MDRALTATELLAVWERARFQTPVDRALQLLTLAEPDVPIESLAQWSVGRRDARLLTLRERLFGPQLTAQACCPACGRTVELNFAADDIRASAAAEPNAVITIETDGRELQFRLPNSADLANMIPRGEAEPANLAAALVARCALPPSDGTAQGPLPEKIIQAVSEKMSAADPQGDVQLDVSCPECAHRWQAPFDIAAFLWTELHGWATSMLRDVHALARAYGWREADILAMSPQRREAYLELIGG